MFSHVPAALPARPPLMVVLHGCAQTAAAYDLGAGWSTLADRYGFAILLPEQQRSNNPQNCFNWFQPGDIARDQGEALSIRQMIDTMVAAHGIDRDRIFVTGLSAGGAMTSVMLATYPDVFAGGAIIAGLPYRSATNVQQALESMFQSPARPARDWGDLVRAASPHKGPWPRVSVWHGGADATVTPGNANEIVKQWTNVHGLPAVPTREDIVDGYPRQVWRNAAGDEIVESYTIAHMAHGTPLATRAAEERYGVAGPFFIEAGISSSYHIAKFFGLVTQARAATAAKDIPLAIRLAQSHAPQPDAGKPKEPEAREPEPQVLEGEILEKETEARAEPPRAPHGRSFDIHAIITKALRAAGLMKTP